MLSKCGTDIIEISRVKESIEKHGDRFLNTVFTKKEIEYCESHKNQKFQHYAVRFAAKEAIFKAISENIEVPEEWKSFEVYNIESGKPKVNIYMKVKNLNSIDISLSHCKDYAIAYVVANFKEK